MTDARSALAAKIMNANPEAYQALVVTARTPAQAHELLDGVQPEQVLGVPVKSPVAASAMLAGLWLWHDGLEECHSIVQKSPRELLAWAQNRSGNSLGVYEERSSMQSVEKMQDMEPVLSYWHAIMHRREGDFSNSKYWYRRTDALPLLATLAVRAGDIINPLPADKSVYRITASGWNPAAFVDLVEQVHEKPDDPRHRLAVLIQGIEWQTLFEHCTRAAS